VLEHLFHVLAMLTWGGKLRGVSKGWETFANSLHCVHLGAIFHGMKREVDFWDGLLLLKSSESIVHLDSVLNPMWKRASLRLAFHGRELENENEGLSVSLSSSKVD
jgi:hypothetical protein